MINGRHPYRRLLFFGVVLACWVVGLFGLDRSRMSSFQLPIVVGAGFVAYALVVAVRRRLEDTRELIEREADEAPPNCVVIRRFGEDRELLSRNVKVIQPSAPAPPIEASPVELRPVLVAATMQTPPRQPRRTEKKPQLNYIPLTGL